MKTLYCTLLSLVAAITPCFCHAAEPANAPAAQALNWRMIGPFRGGRTRAVSGVPGHPGVFFIGAVNGGVWKTDDYGRTWRPVFDAQPTQSIGAIAVAPSDSKIVYVGSGEGLHRPDLSIGDGMYRSDDGGETWKHLGLPDAQQIPDLAVDPRDAHRVFAAVLGRPYGPSAERGIYRSEDGGVHWTQVLHKDENTGGSCVVIDPFDPNVVYAALWNVRSGPWEDNDQYNGTAGGLYKSTDGGATWRQISAGLPEDLSQIQIAVAPSQRGRLYATAGTSAPGGYSSAAGLGVYRSEDSGEHWSRITTDPRPALRIGGGDLPILKVDPRNADVLYSASLVTVKSTDGGVSWMSIRGAPGGDDYQNLWISPDDSKVIALVADQGAIVTVNGGRTWSSWFNQPTAQLYRLAVSNGFPYRVCSGQQESGSVCISSRGNDGQITAQDWHPAGVIEYGNAVPDPLDANIVYGAGRNEVTRTDLVTGQVRNITPIPITGPDIRVNRTEPLFFSPHDPHTMYYAANRLYQTKDAGQSWRVVSPDLTRESAGVPSSVGKLFLSKAEKQRGVIYAASASPLRDGMIWLGTDDGLIWRREAADTEWINLTPPQLTAWSKVTQIDASHFDPQVAYVAVNRMRIDDLKPYIYRTGDGGKSWQLIVDGLPGDAPVNTVREDPARRGLLFAGTEKAVWVSFDDGVRWQPLQLNLPHTSMRDLVIHDQDLILATHGRSLWILDDISPLRQYEATTAKSAAVLLQPAPAIRVQRDTNTDTPIPPDEPTARNPPDGAVLDYSLAQDAKGEVAIDILNAAGERVRRYSSADPPAFDAEEIERELIPQYWIRMPRSLPTTAGMHRWVWDLHYESPRTPQRGFPIAAVPGDTPQAPLGPYAVPGNYRVRLHVGTRQWEQMLEVRADPRVIVDAQSLEDQFKLSRRLAEALDRSTTALFEARSLRAQAQTLETGDAIKRLASQAKGIELAARSKVYQESVEALITGDDKPSATPGLETLNGNIAALYNQLNRADAAPTQAQSMAAAHAIDDWQQIAVGWERVRGADTVALNNVLRRMRLAPLRPELAPPKDLDFADIE